MNTGFCFFNVKIEKKGGEMFTRDILQIVFNYLSVIEVIKVRRVARVFLKGAEQELRRRGVSAHIFAIMRRRTTNIGRRSLLWKRGQKNTVVDYFLQRKKEVVNLKTGARLAVKYNSHILKLHNFYYQIEKDISAVYDQNLCFLSMQTCRPREAVFPGDPCYIIKNLMSDYTANELTRDVAIVSGGKLARFDGATMILTDIKIDNSYLRRSCFVGDLLFLNKGETVFIYDFKTNRHQELKLAAYIYIPCYVAYFENFYYFYDSASSQVIIVDITMSETKIVENCREPNFSEGIIYGLTTDRNQIYLVFNKVVRYCRLCNMFQSVYLEGSTFHLFSRSGEHLLKCLPVKS